MNELMERQVEELSKVNIVIKTEEDCSRANLILKNIKEMATKVKDTFDPIVAKAHSAHREATAQRAKFLDPLIATEKAIKNRIAQYFDQQEQIRLKIQREADEKARREAARLLERAEKAESKGNEAKAESLRQEAVVKESLVPEIPQAKKPEGLGVRKVWKGKVINKALVPDQFKIIDESAINKVLQATSGTMEIPGVQAYQESIVSSRRGWDE